MGVWIICICFQNYHVINFCFYRHGQQTDPSLPTSLALNGSVMFEQSICVFLKMRKVILLSAMTTRTW